MTDPKMLSVIEKVKKLFALAHRTTGNDGASNQTEAAVALARAQELLAKYNLDLAQIKDSEAAALAGAGTGPREKVKINRSAQYRWQQAFWAALAEMNFCFHWVVQVREEHKSSRTGRDYRVAKRHVILGSQANVAVVTMMGEYLTEVLERELPYTQQERLSRAALSWREGAAERLIERLREKTAAMKREGFKAADGGQVTALAVQDLHEKEYAANYDAAYGAGAYARAKARSAARDKEVAEQRKAKAEARARTLAGETPEQRDAREHEEAAAAAKQQARQAKEWERWRRRQYREEQREAARLDLAAYARGTKKANEINLDSQVKPGDQKGQLR